MSSQDQPPQQGTFVTGGGAALDTALAYHRAWTSHDFDRAMTYIDGWQASARLRGRVSLVLRAQADVNRGCLWGVY